MYERLKTYGFMVVQKKSIILIYRQYFWGGMYVNVLDDAASKLYDLQSLYNDCYIVYPLLVHLNSKIF